MQRSLAPIIAGCITVAAFVFAAPKPASAMTAFAPAVHYGETAIVEPVGRYYRGRGYRRYGYGRGYRNYGYRNYGYGRGYGTMAIGVTATAATVIGATDTAAMAIPIIPLSPPSRYHPQFGF